jgi:hypothetical protein
MSLTRRGKVIAAALVVPFLAAVALIAATRGPHLTVPDDPCSSPPPMQTYRGVTLQPIAMTAFKEADAATGHRIEVVESYRPCNRQAIACRSICGDPGGCPGRCAAPGTSYHQLGAAIDISERSLGSLAIIAALERAGWCESVPDSDPGHFSYGGCH